MSSPASLPKEIHRSAEQGELQKVVKWLRKGGAVDAFFPTTARDGRPTTDTLLLAAAATGHLALVPEPQPSQHDPRLQRGGLSAFDSITVAPGAT